MLSELGNLEDLQNLCLNNYSISIIEAHLVINDVYYLDGQGNLQKGYLAAPLNQPTPETLGPPVNHQMYWSGSAPHYVNGTAIGLAIRDANLQLAETRYSMHLSNKPPEGFPTYFLLVEHYVALISAPAEAKYGVNSRTGATYNVPQDTSPFTVKDTFSARAEITDLNKLLTDDRIAIIGLGGMGSFVLDFMVKTPVSEINAYDFDIFEVHNSFRSPGEIPLDQFGHLKTDIYRRKYEKFRHRLKFHNKRIQAGDDELLAGITFAFLCIDDGESRRQICEMLVRLEIPFIDVGMGIEKEPNSLDGLIRTTLFTKETASRAIMEVPMDSAENEGAYRVFVQIAELNALNAALAVIRYKQLRGFYVDETKYYQGILSLGLSNWVCES